MVEDPLGQHLSAEAFHSCSVDVSATVGLGDYILGRETYPVTIVINVCSMNYNVEVKSRVTLFLIPPSTVNSKNYILIHLYLFSSCFSFGHYSSQDEALN